MNSRDIETTQNRKIIHKNINKVICRHDYKNAIKVGNVDYQCPLCRKLLDPLEWFLMNSFEFIDVRAKIVAKRGGSVAGKARKETEKEIGRSVVSKGNYLNKPESQKRLRTRK